MNAAADIVTTLLDSSAKEFMKSYTQERPMRWEFTPSTVSHVLEVKRWNFEGSYNYVGSVRRNGDRWWTHTVAPRNFYGQGLGNITHVRHTYVSHVGPFDTKETAAEKLWELYEEPR
jgi:hypothetical protein